MTTPPIRLVTVDGALAQEERDLGLQQANASAHPRWKAAVRKLIYELPAGWVGIGEDIRLMCLAEGMAPPRSDKCWGGQIMSAIRRGELENVPGYRHMRAVKSHARKSPLLRRTRWV